MRTALPRPLGLYLLLHRLGQGGMGDVFLAKQAGLEGVEQHCVVKAIRADKTTESTVVGRFIDEAALSIHLSHRNICQVFRVGRASGDLFVAMELIAGKTLGEVLSIMLKKKERLPLPIALHCATEMLSALDYAHRLVHPVTGASMHIVHRDVSPQNAMVSFEGEVKLIDFGLAASTLKREQTASGVKVGKVAYMAPEQVLDAPVTGAADQFAAAVVTYELLTGRRFYSGVPPNELLRAVSEGGHIPLLWTELHPDLRKVLHRSLQLNPADRFENCGAMRKALTSHIKAEGLLADADDVRALLAREFPDGPAEQRRLLQSFASLKPPAPDQADQGFEEFGSQVAPVAPAVTEVLLSNPNVNPLLTSVPAQVTGVHQPVRVDLPPPERKSPTKEPAPPPAAETSFSDQTVRVARIGDAHLPAPASPSKPLPIMAGVILGLVIIVAGLMVLIQREPHSPRVGEGSGPAATPGDIRPGDAPPHSVAALQEPTATSASDPENSATTTDPATNPLSAVKAGALGPEAGEPELHAAHDPQPAASAEPEPDSDRPAPPLDAGREVRSEVVEAAEAAEVGGSRDGRRAKTRRARSRRGKKETKRGPPPTRSPRTNKEKQDVLKWCRGKETCARRFLTKMNKLGSLPPAAIRSLIVEVDACVSRCLK